MATDPKGHLFIRRRARADRYVPRRSGSRQDKRPSRDRALHGAGLRACAENARDEAYRRLVGKTSPTSDYPDGVFLEVEGGPELVDALKSLDAEDGSIEMMNTHEVGDRWVVLIYVPDRHFKRFLMKIDKYLKSLQKNPDNPENGYLIDRIDAIRLATVASFWTDHPSRFPAEGVPVWWEVWLRGAKKHLEQFRRFGKAEQLLVGEDTLTFLDRTVVLAFGTREQIARSVDFLSVVAELREAKDTPQRFMKMTPFEQHEVVQELLDRTTPAAISAPAVCILDTGVNHPHPLLKHSLDESDLHSYDPRWGNHDHEGHGTEMAGLALYGDLRSAAARKAPITLVHRLESVKIMPPESIPSNEKRLYGLITATAIAKAEEADDKRKRVISMAISSDYQMDLGRPSSWSAELDNLAAGIDLSGKVQGRRRLMVICAGNREKFAKEPLSLTNPLKSCQDTPIHSPGQSWNALTVGATTELARIEDPTFREWKALPSVGELSPESTTSMLWDERWPLKPDIVMEGGNLAVSPSGSTIATDCLSVLTTNFELLKHPLTTTRATSAATAQAAELAASITSKYPDLWPESIRGLLVHSAKWTPQMLRRINPKGPRGHAEALVRTFGFGIPDRERALHSYGNRFTVILQDEIQPFESYSVPKKGMHYRTKEMHFHEIPWPKEDLMKLGNTKVCLRVTLSYFVEPSPSRRGWNYRHRYASHGLRFDMQTSEESEKEFRGRVNEAARDEEDDIAPSKSDSAEWTLGPFLRGKGSIHSDFWVGDAVQLARRNWIGIYPVIGWWRERHHLDRCNSKARYSLLLSLETEAQSIDLYSQIANQIQIMEKVPVTGMIEVEY